MAATPAVTDFILELKVLSFLGLTDSMGVGIASIVSTFYLPSIEENVLLRMARAMVVVGECPSLSLLA